jgi:hypothetical protein
VIFVCWWFQDLVMLIFITTIISYYYYWLPLLFVFIIMLIVDIFYYFSLSFILGFYYWYFWIYCWPDYQVRRILWVFDLLPTDKGIWEEIRINFEDSTNRFLDRCGFTIVRRLEVGGYMGERGFFAAFGDVGVSGSLFFD